MNVDRKVKLFPFGMISLMLVLLFLGACQQDSNQENGKDDKTKATDAGNNQTSSDGGEQDDGGTVDDADIEVTLLGTGGPQSFPNRVGYSTLVEAGDETLLFDTGRGVMQRLYESKKDIGGATNIFYTHLHNDHTEGMPSLWMTGWLMHGREEPLNVWGPKGTEHMISGMQDMDKFNVENRPDEQHDAENLEADVTEFEKESEVYNENGVKVTAFPVEHDDGNPAFGYQIEYNDRSVVLSGDTSYHENVVKYGDGADLIVHNVVAISDDFLAENPGAKATLNKLTPPEDAAKVFEETEPKMAIYSHMVVQDIPLEDLEDYIKDETREAGYDGPVEVGEDRTTIKIGDEIEVLPPESKDDLGIEG